MNKPERSRKKCKQEVPHVSAKNVNKNSHRMEKEHQPTFTTLTQFCDLLFEESDGVSGVWLEDLWKDLKTDDPFCTKGGNNQSMMRPRLMGLLNECLSTHQWSEAVPVIQQMSDSDPMTFWKTSMEVLYTAESSQQLVEQMVKQLKPVSMLNRQEVLLEYLLYLLFHNKIDDAKQIQDDTKGKWSTPTERDNHTKICLKAYIGLVWYVEWATHKSKITDTDREDGFVSEVEHLMASLANKAMIGFSSVIGETGVWDIFITKHVELLEYYKKLEEAKDILIQYRDHNKDNLNAHKYLYQFYVRNGVDQEQQIPVLMDIAKCSPSDSMVLQLYDKLIKEKQFCLASKYLFNLLDYPCWQYNKEPWSRLVSLLDKVSNNSTIKESVEENWASRESWWPSYHFTSYGCTQTEGCDVCFCKAVCAARLLGKGIQKYKKEFSHITNAQFTTIIKEHVT